MGGNNIKNKLAWLERGLLAAGVALLAAFFLIRGWSEHQRQEAVDAFVAGQTSELRIQSRPGGETVVAQIGKPDQALWSEQRIRDFEQSLKVDANLPLALLTIERLDIQVPVYDGAEEFNLNRGVARIRGTAGIDETGNLGVAGHRDSFFRGLKDIKLGDSIELRTSKGAISYQVYSIDIVEPSDVAVLAPTSHRTLTLVTCYPFYYVGHAPKRYIVKAEAEHLLAKT